ncbi:MAG: hypothetical protein H3C45_00620 [Bacteroidia bacterium]|nr:hypothetical protein [Bacteroidia bacterium]MCC7533704.1 hypothetical protein [Bacteroidia bacterium]
MEEKITVLTKRKNITLLFDYFMDQKVVFTVTPRAMINDEFEVDLSLTNIKQAIAVGMFLKENKFDVFGLGEFVKTKPNSTNGKKAEAEIVNNKQSEESASQLAF